MTEEKVESDSSICVQARDSHPDLLSTENANLKKKIFLQMIFKKYLTQYSIITSLVEPWRIYKVSVDYRPLISYLIYVGIVPSPITIIAGPFMSMDWAPEMIGTGLTV